MACNDRRAGGSALDARTTRHAGYRWSQRIRKGIEEGFGWGKDGRPLRKMKHTGLAQVSFLATLTIGCYALLCVARLLAPPQTVPTLGSAQRPMGCQVGSTNSSGLAEPEPNRNFSISSARNFRALGSIGDRRYSFISVV